MNKYRAVKTTVDNIPFDSKREAQHYRVLKLLFKIGEIQNLEVHPVFPLHVDYIRIGKYIADFRYFQDGERVVEDVKGGPIPPLSRWKIKHAEAEYKIKVKIVR